MAAIFFDIDGTLWGRDGVIPESTKTALASLKEQGHFIFICSGRCQVNIRDPKLLALGFDGILCGCGTHVIYHGEDLLYHTLDKDLIRRSVDLFYRYEMPVVMESKNWFFMDADIMQKDPYGRFLMESMPDVIQPITGNEENWEVNKYCVVIKGTPYEEVLSALKDEYEFMLHSDIVMDVVPKGYSKATAIALICEKLGVPREETYAFGDSSNDIEMLKYCQVGVAMGNADDQTKESADYITADLTEDGIFKACADLGLIS